MFQFWLIFSWLLLGAFPLAAVKFALKLQRVYGWYIRNFASINTMVDMYTFRHSSMATFKANGQLGDVFEPRRAVICRGQQKLVWKLWLILEWYYRYWFLSIPHFLSTYMYLQISAHSATVFLLATNAVSKVICYTIEILKNALPVVCHTFASHHCVKLQNSTVLPWNRAKWLKTVTLTVESRESWEACILHWSNEEAKINKSFRGSKHCQHGKRCSLNLNSSLSRKMLIIFSPSIKFSPIFSPSIKFSLFAQVTTLPFKGAKRPL